MKRTDRPPHPPDHECGAKVNSGLGCKQPAGFKTDHVGQGRCYLHGGKTPVKTGLYSTVTTRPRIRELTKHFEEVADPLDLTPEITMLRALLLDFTERYDQFTEGLLAWHASFSHGFNEAMNLYTAAYANWRLHWKEFSESLETYRTEVEAAQRHYAQGWPEPPEVPAFPMPPMSPPDPIAYQSKPTQVLDILSAGKFLVQVGQLADRIKSMRESGTITLEAFNSLYEKLGIELVFALRETVSDETLRSEIIAAVESRWGAIEIPTGKPSR